MFSRNTRSLLGLGLAGRAGCRKAVIFTESRRTQQYLFDLLTTYGYAGELVMMNSANADPHSPTVYEEWVQRHASQEVVTSSRPVGVKAAIVEHFRDPGQLLLAFANRQPDEAWGKSWRVRV